MTTPHAFSVSVVTSIDDCPWDTVAEAIAVPAGVLNKDYLFEFRHDGNETGYPMARDVSFAFIHLDGQDIYHRSQRGIDGDVLPHHEAAVMTAGQGKFFAGTDSAPHTTKATACGCAAGCFTGGCAPQLYAMAFEEAGADLASAAGKELFERFLCLNGPAFYGFAASQQTFQMEKASSQAVLLETPAGTVTPLPVGLNLEMSWRLV